MAVVVAADCPEMSGLRDWCRRWHVTVKAFGGNAVFLAGCRCGNSGESELRALGMAFIVAYELMKVRNERRVEIVSDSLSAIHEVMGSGDSLPFSASMQRLWRQRRIIVSKVRAHQGNRLNDLADICARQARRITEKRVEIQSGFRRT